MNVGQVISALTLCASNWDDNNGDYLLMVKEVCLIDVKDDSIEAYFVDGNTPAIRISKDGTKSYFEQ